MVQILSGAMAIYTFPSGPFATNCYLFTTPDGGCFVIDAPPDSYSALTQVLKENNLTPSHLLLTHSHWDHIGDAALFKKNFPSLIIAIHADDIENLEHPGSDGLPLWIPIEGIKPDLLIKEGDRIGTLQVIDSPGHTPGGVCFYDETNKVLFSGDTLFQGTIGNLSFPTARPEMMWKSLKKLATLPEDVAVYPGHGEMTTMGAERWLSRAEEIFGS